MESNQTVTVQLSAEQWQSLIAQFNYMADKLDRLQNEIRQIEDSKARRREKKERENYVPWGGPDAW